MRTSSSPVKRTSRNISCCFTTTFLSNGAGGTLNVLRAAAAAGVRRFVLMSTGSTMCGWEWDESLPYGRLAAGERDLPPWDLLDYRTPPRPDSPYGAAKLFCEAAGRWFSDQTPI